MKRIVLIIGALLLGLSVRAQSVTYTCRYWFDQNFAQATMATFSDSTWQAELDVGSLSEGLHTLHLHVMDTSLKWSAPQSYMFLRISETPSADMSYHYWFDQDHAFMQNGVLGDGSLLLDVADLTAGLHTLHVMLKGEEYTASQSYLFLKTDAWESGTSNYIYHCWFDEDFANQQTDTLGTGHLFLDVADLEEGMHAVHVLVEGNTLTSTQSYMFMKVAPFAADSIDMSHLAYRCWFDEDFEHQQTDSIGDGQFLLDVSDLEDGLHTVHVMLQGSTLTATQSYMFMKIAVEDPSADLQYICWFDQDYSSVQTGPLGSGLFELEVSDLTNGLHTVNVQLDNGTRTAPQCYLFYKQPLGGYGIARWEYWLNDDFEDRSTTIFTTSVDTLDIISLLTVGHPALRSSCFHFHPNGDAPYINAKNQITFRFWDSEMHFIDKSAFYVDEQVQQEIVATVFERNTTETFAAPRDNQIQWFKLDAGVGDSLAFKADKACTMQLFAPSGEEVYAATASEAIVFGGCHAWEDGTYYLAVHDVTGSGETVSVTYQYIHKYAILACSPESVGNAVGSSFSFYYIGNGLESIENIYLTHEGDTLVMDTIPYSAISQSYALFNIVNPIPNGIYDATFVFSDSTGYEIVEYSNALMLEEPVYGDIVVSYNSPSQMAKPYPVTITLENTGNMDYSYIPFNMAVDNVDRIENFNFENFYITKSEAAADSGYYFNVITDNLFNRGINGCMVFSMLPALSAHEKMTFWVSFDAPGHSRFNLYAWTDLSLEQEILLYQDTVTQGRADGDHEMWDRYSNTLNPVELIGDVPEQVRQILPNPYRENLRGATGALQDASQIESNSIQIGGAITGIHWALENQRMSAYLDMGAVPFGYEDEYRSYMRDLPSPERISPFWGGWMMRIEHMMGRQQEAAQIPTPNPGTPYPIHVVVPGDPNDIQGYLSESGSHYMRQDIQTVQYEIEFENDTTLATAAAHTIIVRDTLNRSRFDLNSLAARSVTIGDKRLDLNGEQTFARTLDLRPELYVIAQVEQDYDPTTGIIQWTIQSLDPMTMEPTDDPNQGVLPVNYYGNGVGFIDYSINLKHAFPDGAKIRNRAGIIFDQNEVIMTPIWTNIIDAVEPTSHIENVTFEDDTLNFSFVSSDNRSGVWYHTLYYRNDSTEMEWQVKVPRIFENSYLLRFDEYQTTEYLVMAVDSAGNHEEKGMVAEYVHYYDGPEPVCQTNTLSSGWNWFSTYLDINLDQLKAALVEAVPGTVVSIKSRSQNTTYNPNTHRWNGNVTWDLSKMYLIKVDADCEVSLQGFPVDPTQHPVTIGNGVNWIAFPLNQSMSITNAFVGFAVNGDQVKSRNQNATYTRGRWMGQLNTLEPGKGYIYISNTSGDRVFTYPVNAK